MRFLLLTLCGLAVVSCCGDRHGPVSSTTDATPETAINRDPCSSDDCTDWPSDLSCKYIQEQGLCDEPLYTGWCCKSCANKHSCH